VFLRSPNGCSIPKNFSLGLHHLSDVNNRICSKCQVNHAKGVGKLPVRKKLRLPGVRMVVPRKESDSVTSSILLEAFAGRSEAAQRKAIEMAGKWADSNSHVWENGTILQMLQNTRCTNKVMTFGREKECLGQMEFQELDAKGSRRTVRMICTLCGHVMFYSSHTSDGKVTLECGQDIFSFRKEDVRDVLLVLLSGSTYTVYSTIKSPNVHQMAESTFYRIQKALCDGLVKVCQDILRDSRESICAQLQATNSKWVAQLNGAWSHRGWTARHHTFLVRAKDQNKVVSAIVLTKKHVAFVQSPGGIQIEKEVHTGNYVGTSKGMEGEAFVLALKELEESDLLGKLDTIVCDGDSGIPKILANTAGCENVKLAGDPGHMQRNFFRSLQDIFGVSKRYRGYPYRIGKFFMRCLKDAESKFEGHSEDAVALRKNHFDTLWKHAFNHYTRKECPKSCPCNEFYRETGEKLDANDIFVAHALSSFLDVDGHAGSKEQNIQSEVEAEVEDPDEVVREVIDGEEVSDNCRVKVRREAKAWLNTEDDAKDKEMAAKMKPILQLAGDNVSDVLFGLNTCLSECSNIRRLVFCRKDRFYYQTYEVRSLLSAVMENVGRDYLLQKIYEHFNLEWDEDAERVKQTFERKDEKREKHSERKKSRGYVNRQAVISKNRIAENIAAAAESKKRKESRGYTKLGGKKLKAGVFDRHRGPKSQEELKAAFARGERVSHCQKCNKYFKNTHNRCKPKQEKKKQQGQKQARERARLKKGKKPAFAPPPSPVLSTLQWSIEEPESRSADDDSSSIAERVHNRRTRRRIDADIGWEDILPGNSSILSAPSSDDG
jgi:hypothetical protein